MTQLQGNNNTASSQAQVFIQPGFSWDAQSAYLFDIDGTLLRSRDRVHYDAFRSSVRRVAGIELSLEDIPMQGNVDPAILRAAFEQAGIAESEWKPMLKPILDAMCEDVALRRQEMDLYAMPGVEATLRHLKGKGAAIGLATGNLEMIGWIKVEQLGLREWFRFGGFSDQVHVRTEMIAHAAIKARQIAGADASICVVGDTPHDITAAKANSLPTIAVATGHFSFSQLMDYKPEVCTTTLTDLLRATEASA